MLHYIPKKEHAVHYIYRAMTRIAATYKVPLVPFGKSHRGHTLLALKLGEGERISLLVGAFHAMEYMTSFLLLEFSENLLLAKQNGTGYLGKSAEQIAALFKNKTVYIIPLLNPDGVEIERGECRLTKKERDALVKMNGSEDFTLWQANARGVDLNHNFDAGFDIAKKMEKEYGVLSPCRTRYGGDAPESESESYALADLTRSLKERLSLVLALHTQGEEIYFDYMGRAPDGSASIAAALSSLSGYRIASPRGIASYGGYKDFVIDKLGIPAFTLECGKGENPLPDELFPEIYKKTADALLFSAAF